jgi:hypothetical protein
MASETISEIIRKGIQEEGIKGLRDFVRRQYLLQVLNIDPEDFDGEKKDKARVICEAIQLFQHIDGYAKVALFFSVIKYLTRAIPDPTKYGLFSVGESFVLDDMRDNGFSGTDKMLERAIEEAKRNKG